MVPSLSRAPGFATEDNDRARDSSAAPGNAQDNFGKPIQEGVLEMRRGPEANPNRPTDSMLLGDCLLSAMDAVDRQLRLANDFRLGVARRSSQIPAGIAPRDHFHSRLSAYEYS